jgi:protease I
MRKLIGKRAVILVCSGFEQVQLTEPRMALEDEGVITDVVSPEPRRVRSWKHTDWARTFRVDVGLADADPSRYDLLLLPGGVVNSDRLRLHPMAIAFIGAFAAADKPLAAIGHGPWPLIDAGCVAGKVLTSWPSLQADLRNAGAFWVDEEVVRDGKLVTSRKPADIPSFSRKVIDLIAEEVAIRPPPRPEAQVR